MHVMVQGQPSQALSLWGWRPAPDSQRLHLRGWRRGLRQCSIDRGTLAAAGRDPHELLGVPASASVDDIKAAFRRQALRLHPDVNQAADAQERFIHAQQAYRQLLQERQRGSGGWRHSPAATPRSRSSSSSGGGGVSEEGGLGISDFLRELEEDLVSGLGGSGAYSSGRRMAASLGLSGAAAAMGIPGGWHGECPPVASEVLARGVRISASSACVPRPLPGRHLFEYTIRVANEGAAAVQLGSHFWVITDAHGSTQEVCGLRGPGEQPLLWPGQFLELRYACMLHTSVGSLEGFFEVLPLGGEAGEAQAFFAFLGQLGFCAGPVCEGPREVRRPLEGDGYDV